jgi:hypothetical protein
VFSAILIFVVSNILAIQFIFFFGPILISAAALFIIAGLFALLSIGIAWRVRDK